MHPPLKSSNQGRSYHRNGKAILDACTADGKEAASSNRVDTLPEDLEAVPSRARPAVEHKHIGGGDGRQAMKNFHCPKNAMKFH